MISICDIWKKKIQFTCHDESKNVVLLKKSEIISNWSRIFRPVFGVLQTKKSDGLMKIVYGLIRLSVG